MRIPKLTCENSLKRAHEYHTKSRAFSKNEGIVVYFSFRDSLNTKGIRGHRSDTWDLCHAW
jgi:hypothetical protein